LRHNLLEVADELSDADYKEFHRLVQDMALRAYPNPDRIGCPGGAALEEVASLPLSSRHTLFQEHISHCSPCLARLLEIRRQNYRNRVRASRRTWFVGACAAAVILMAGVTLTVRKQTTSVPSAQAPNQPSTVSSEETARLDLSDETGLRNDERSRKTEMPHQLPRKRVTLSVILPFGSPPGRYQFGLFQLDQTPLATTAGDAQVSRGTTTLSVGFDLSGYPASQYLVGVKRESGDWTLHELTIR
jgi:hypothetical protein